MSKIVIENLPSQSFIAKAEEKEIINTIGGGKKKYCKADKSFWEKLGYATRQTVETVFG